MIGFALGTVLSPYAFNATGYYGIYIARLVMVALALVYWLRSIKTPEELGVATSCKGEEKGDKQGDSDQDDQSSKVGRN